MANNNENVVVMCVRRYFSKYFDLFKKKNDLKTLTLNRLKMNSNDLPKRGYSNVVRLIVISKTKTFNILFYEKCQIFSVSGVSPPHSSVGKTFGAPVVWTLTTSGLY